MTEFLNFSLTPFPPSQNQPLIKFLIKTHSAHSPHTNLNHVQESTTHAYSHTWHIHRKMATSSAKKKRKMTYTDYFLATYGMLCSSPLPPTLPPLFCTNRQFFLARQTKSQKGANRKYGHFQAKDE